MKIKRLFFLLTVLIFSLFFTVVSEVSFVDAGSCSGGRWYYCYRCSGPPYASAGTCGSSTGWCATSINCPCDCIDYVGCADCCDPSPWVNTGEYRCEAGNYTDKQG